MPGKHESSQSNSDGHRSVIPLERFQIQDNSAGGERQSPSPPLVLKNS